MITRNAPPSTQAAATTEPCIYIVDDDQSVRDALSSLFRSVGYKVQLYGATADFMQAKRSDGNSCLVLDIRLPGASGLDLQTHLNREQIPIPVIFMTGHGDIPMSVRAMKAGAIDFLAKPFRDQDMLDAVANALDADRKRRDTDGSMAGIRAAFETLTSREREIMTAVTAGLMNKQVAGNLGLSEITVKIHRASAMKKMGCQTLADLVRMASLLGLDTSKS
ncbi:response regulator transcription factor [Dongia sedimenti]|uniref:Response regulator transcription factor n=1 Tax=Dongia sedimenti TaxID=3064282 RepID=A0ABU0YUQ5_9PROT|nr:response regulator transcription factor [Rhodospirillaceae bacterium R-7]